jgi:hypothetical protein
MKPLLTWVIPSVIIFVACFCLFYFLGRMVLSPVPALQGEAGDLAFVMSTTVTLCVMMFLHRARNGKR